MKLLYLKRKAKCHECGEEITTRQPAIKEWVTKYWMGNKSFTKRVCYHWKCFKEKGDLFFEQHPAAVQKRKAVKRKQKKVGRPRKALYNKKRRALLSLLIYHKKKGNAKRTAELEKEIQMHENLTNPDALSKLSTMGSLTEYPATQGKGGCRVGDEPTAQANSVRANCSAVQP